MSAITITGFVHLSPYSTAAKPDYLFFSCDMTAHGYTCVGPASFEYTVPADFSVQRARIDALKTEQLRINAEFAKRTKAINEQISQLEAIEYTAS